MVYQYLPRTRLQQLELQPWFAIRQQVNFNQYITITTNNIVSLNNVIMDDLPPCLQSSPRIYCTSIKANAHQTSSIASTPIDHVTAIRQAYTSLTFGTNPLSRLCKSYHNALTNFSGTSPKTCLCMSPCSFECFIISWIDDIADYEFELLTTRLGRVCTQRFAKSYQRHPRKMQWAPVGVGEYMEVPKFACEAYFGFMNHLNTLDDATLAILCREHEKQLQSRDHPKGKRAIRKADEGIGANVPIRERVRQNRDGEVVWSGTTFSRWGIILVN